MTTRRKRRRTTTSYDPFSPWYCAREDADSCREPQWQSSLLPSGPPILAAPCQNIKWCLKSPLSQRKLSFFRIHHLIHKISINFPNNQESNPFLKLRLLCCLRGSETLTTTRKQERRQLSSPRGTMPEHSLRAETLRAFWPSNLPD